MTHAESFARAWRLAFGVPPGDITVIDLESSGFSVEEDYVVQIGLLRAVDGVEAQREALVLDWTRCLDAHGRADLGRRLSSTGNKMRARGRVHGWSLDRLAAEGVHPREAVARLGAVLSARPVLVGHNAWRYDVPVLDALAARITGLPLGVPPTQLIDTNAAVRACQSGALPKPGETYRDFSLRANSSGGNRYRSSLDEFCVGRFKLASRFGADAGKAHDAAYDCWLCHLVYEDLRDLVSTGKLRADSVRIGTPTPATPW